MRIIADLVTCENGVMLFDTDGYTPNLESDKKYTLEVKPYKSSRSLEQNRLMWAIIQEIAKDTGNDEMTVYIQGLKHVKAKFEWYASLPEAIEALKNGFRAVEDVGACEINGKPARACKCYVGSSKFNAFEMKQLIDYFINLAHELGIKIEEYQR